MDVHSDQPPIIRVEDASSFHAQTDWIMAALLLGAAGAVVWFFKLRWNFDFDSPDFNPAIFVPMFLGAYGLKHLTLSVRETLRARRFGSSVLEIQGRTVRMGETIKGVVRTPVELRPRSDYEIRLQCIETFEMRKGTSDSTRNVDRIRWEASNRVPFASVNSKAGIPFGFTLPEPFKKSQPGESGSVQASWVAAINIPGLQNVFAHNQAPRATRWVLEAKAELKGIDYYAIFGVVVENSTRDDGVYVEIPLSS
jgi:hypothetical protein